MPASRISGLQGFGGFLLKLMGFCIATFMLQTDKTVANVRRQTVYVVHKRSDPGEGEIRL
jgi:hypothetical protein